MAKIGLIDCDSHHFPSLPLMKLSAWHKAHGDHVEWWSLLGGPYDRVYESKVFTWSDEPPYLPNAKEVIQGGTGFGLDNKLTDDVEHIMPDYSLYGITDTAYGFLTRGCPRNCSFCIVSKKEGRKSVKVADLSEFWSGQKNIKLLDPNILACRERDDLLDQLAESGAWVDITQGLDARLLTENIVEKLNRIKMKMIHFAWDNVKDEDVVLRGLRIYAEHGKIKERNRVVYVLTNYNSTHEEDLRRIYGLREIGFSPFVMVFDKDAAPSRTKHLARWCNKRFIFRACPWFEDYNGGR